MAKLNEYHVAVSRCGKRKGHDGREPVGARTQALALARVRDAPVAEDKCFLAAWRTECPWIIVCTSVSMFTKCSLCNFILLLIDQTPRGQELLRQAFRYRLGSHFEFQGAQRLAHNRIEESCEQSEGRKWFMLIDKMNQATTVCPSIWTQLSTQLFEDKENC